MRFIPREAEISCVFKNGLIRRLQGCLAGLASQATVYFGWFRVTMSNPQSKFIFLTMNTTTCQTIKAPGIASTHRPSSTLTLVNRQASYSSNLNNLPFRENDPLYNQRLFRLQNDLILITVRTKLFTFCCDYELDYSNVTILCIQDSQFRNSVAKSINTPVSHLMLLLSEVKFDDSATVFPPPKFLVGVETNPGPFFQNINLPLAIFVAIIHCFIPQLWYTNVLAALLVVCKQTYDYMFHPDHNFWIVCDLIEELLVLLCYVDPRFFALHVLFKLYLVGIELNPGPVFDIQSEIHRRVHLYANDHGISPALVCSQLYGPSHFRDTFCNVYGFTPSQVRHYVRDVADDDMMCDDDEVNVIFNALTEFSIELSISYRKLIFILDENTRFASSFADDHEIQFESLVIYINRYIERTSAAVIAARLIGIETNPGPNNQIISFLKNMEREQSAPTPKGARVHRPSKGDLALQKSVEKFRSQKLKQQRDRKYRPEGLLDVGLNDETRDFIVQSLATLRETLRGGIDLKLDFTTKLSDTLASVMKQLAAVGGVVLDYVKFVVCLISRTISEKYREAFNFVCSFVIGFLPEGIIDSAFLMILFKDTLGKHMATMDVLNIIKTLSRMKDTSKEMNGSFDFVIKVLRDVTHALNMTFGWTLPTSLSDDPVDVFFSRFYALRKSFRDQNSSDYETAVALFILQEDVERFYRKENEPAPKERALYLLNVLKPFVTQMEASVNPNDGPRTEPLAILTAGPTAVGKSTFTVPTLLSILPHVIAKNQIPLFLENHNQFIFYRNGENDFWDGMRTSHQVIVFDDFGQLKDVAGGASTDAFSIIRLKNTAPYHLHFSSIAEKQKNYAKPKLVYATTNRNTLNFNSIISNEAVIRRFDIAVCQVPKVEFCMHGYDVMNPWSRRLDLDKVRAKYPYIPDDPTTFAELDVIELIEWDFVHGVPKSGGRTFTFEEFRAHAIKVYLDLSSRGDAMLKYHSHIKNKYLPESGLDDDLSMDEFHDAHESNAYLIKDLFDSLTETDTSKGSFPILKKILFFSSSILGAIALLGKAREWFGASSPESSGDKTKRAIKKAQRSKVRSLRRVMKGMTPEAGVANYDFQTKVLKRNMYLLKIDGETLGFATFIRGSTFVIPRHFEDAIDNHVDANDSDGILQFCSPITGEISYQCYWYNSMKRFDFDECDLVLLKLDRCYREHSDITKHFPLEKNLVYGNKYNANMIVRRNDFVTVLQTVVGISSDVSYMSYVSSKLQYSAPTTNGDCGSLLFTQDTRFSMPTILGMHTSGTTITFGAKYCAGVALVQEDLLEALEFMEDDEPLYENFTTEDGVSIHGFNALSKKQGFRTATKTKIEKSPLYGSLWPVTTAPARLIPFVQDGKRTVPAENARNKYIHTNPIVDLSILDRVYPFIRNMLLTDFQTRPWAPHVYTFEEAVSGVDGVDFCDGIARSTSPGYPFVLDNKSKGKTAWLGEDGKVDFSTEGAKELALLVSKIIEDAKNGIRNEHLFMDCLKDERRSHAKVLQGKTRQIMASPMTLLISSKQYFGDFIRHVCLNKIFNGSAVGINPVTDWSILAERLSMNGVKFTAGDFSSFDCKIPTQVGWEVLNIIEEFYVGSTAEERRVRRVLFHEIINSMHITSDGIVYELIGGNASGNFMTAVYNSICNLILIISCILKEKDDCESSLSDDEVFQNIRLIVFGDDNVIGYTPIASEFAKQSVITKQMKILFDYEYTDESKTGVFREHRDISEVSFLKRAFRFSGQQVFAPLELTVVQETLNWCKGTSDEGEFFLRLEAVATELSYHGKIVFDTNFPLIQKRAFDIMNYRIVANTFEKALTGEHTLANN